jgi:hypothetical protein
VSFADVFRAVDDMLEGAILRKEHEANPLPSPQSCSIDGKPILMLAFKNTGVCSELCRKARDKESS